MQIISDYFGGIYLLLGQASFWGFSSGVLIAAVLLIVLIGVGLFFAVRLANELLCISKQRTPDYMFIGKEDREWYQLATMLLARAECVIGKSARTIVRGLPGIKLSESGAFDSLGAQPFEGLLSVAAALRKEAGLLTILPLFKNSNTRKVMHLIPH